MSHRSFGEDVSASKALGGVGKAAQKAAKQRSRRRRKRGNRGYRGAPTTPRSASWASRTQSTAPASRSEGSRRGRHRRPSRLGRRRPPGYRELHHPVAGLPAALGASRPRRPRPGRRRRKYAAAAASKVMAAASGCSTPRSANPIGFRGGGDRGADRHRGARYQKNRPSGASSAPGRASKTAIRRWWTGSWTPARPIISGSSASSSLTTARCGPSSRRWSAGSSTAGGALVGWEVNLPDASAAPCRAVGLTSRRLATRAEPDHPRRNDFQIQFRAVRLRLERPLPGGEVVMGLDGEQHPNIPDAGVGGIVARRTPAESRREPRRRGPLRRAIRAARRAQPSVAARQSAHDARQRGATGCAIVAALEAATGKPDGSWLGPRARRSESSSRQRVDRRYVSRRRAQLARVGKAAASGSPTRS